MSSQRATGDHDLTGVSLPAFVVVAYRKEMRHLDQQLGESQFGPRY
jgi:hypothetical protein